MALLFIEVIFDNIYSFATAKLRLHSNSPFTITIPSTLKVVGLEAGIVEADKCIRSSTDKGMEVIKFTVLGLVSEVPLSCADGLGSVEAYGMQYFPFLSATVKLDFCVQGCKVGAVSLSFPDMYRVIWFRQQLFINSQALNMTHSQGEKESIYVFTPSNNEPVDTASSVADIEEKINGTIPVRLGGKEYLRVATFPMLYFGVSLLAVALLAMQDKPNITFGAVAAFWVLMLRNFNAANAPQLNTVLRDMYFLLGGLLLVWAGAWELFEVKAVVGLLPVAFVYYVLRMINKKFSKEGVLPKFAECAIYRVRRMNEKKNQLRNVS